MNCQRARDVFSELLDTRTAATAHLDARAHLANCPECQREFAVLTQTATALDAMPTPQPSSRLRKNFYAMLEEEKHSAASVRAVAKREQRARRASLWRWVMSPILACALLLLGFALGKRSLPLATSQAPSTEGSTTRELAALREQMTQQREQISDMKKLVSISILQQQQNPANERLKDVLAAAKSANPSIKVLEDLILALALDPNANVRLRAIEALYPHAEREVVRGGVLAALSREQNPLVQLELIDFVAAAQDQNATAVLEKISADETTDRTVRDAAKFALAQF
jgi:hypothetical protein